MTLFMPSIDQATSKKNRNQTMPDLNDFMTTKEAAKKLGFHVKRIPTMVKNKTLDGIPFGRVWLVSKKSVNEYLKRTEGMSKNDPRRKQQK